MSNKKTIKSLKGFNIFNKVFEKSYKLRNSKLLIAYTYDGNKLDNHSNELFFGVSTSKKKSKKAVCRNRIKRLLRQSVRNLNSQTELLENFNSLILVWMIGLDKPMLLKLEDVENEVSELLKKAILKKNETYPNSHN
jgi:ribonuclease P protein component